MNKYLCNITFDIYEVLLHLQQYQQTN